MFSRISIVCKIARLLTFTLGIWLVSAPASAAGSDYMSEELRQQVEELKSAYKAKPTTGKTYQDRATVAWAWLNAHAMRGGTLPVEITAAIRPGLGRNPDKRMIAGLDYFLNELILLDEQPEAIGELTADIGPFEARSRVTLKQQYKVGRRAIKSGGGFLIAKHFMPDYGEFQMDDPAGDNYVSINSTNPEVTFGIDGVPLQGMHGGFRGAKPAKVYRVKSGTLKAGDVVTITYGDKSGGGGGFLINSASTDFLPLPIYLDFEGNSQFFTLPIQPVRVSGTAVAGVHGFAPSVVRPGEPFELSIRAQDRFYNRAKAPIPAFEVYANSQLIATIPASSEAITVLKEQKFSEPGVYRITIKSADGTITGVGNPVLVSADARKIYWGDTHGHSGFAEGIGTPERFMQWAKEDARLDFVTHSEHDIWMDDYEWQVLIDKVSKYSEPGRFTGYLGYEWTTSNIFGGHHNVLFRDIDKRNRIPNQLYPTLSKLYAGLRANYASEDVLVIPHAHQAGDYRQSDPELENLVEIMSQHGTFEWFGQMYLNHGHQVGFIAASDNHLSQPGYTSAKGAAMSQRGGLAAVMAKDNTRDGIFNALKSLHTYATTGDKIILDVSVNGTKMGQRVKFTENRKIEGRVVGTAPIDSLTILRNDKEIWRKDYLTVKSGRYEDEETFYVNFDSQSFPMHPNDNPRGTRSWHGTMAVSGAEIASFEATDFINPEVNRLERDAENSGLLHFATGSRGDTSSIKLKLKNIKRNAKITLDLGEAQEYGSPTRFRKPALIPATQVVLAFKDLENGMTRQVIPIDVYSDTVTLRRSIETGADDVSFSFEDTSVLQGDYYYLRVKLANDAMAWSSPIWVGGFPEQ